MTIGMQKSVHCFTLIPLFVSGSQVSYERSFPNQEKQCWIKHCSTTGRGELDSTLALLSRCSWDEFRVGAMTSAMDLLRWLAKCCGSRLVGRFILILSKGMMILHLPQWLLIQVHRWLSGQVAIHHWPLFKESVECLEIFCEGWVIGIDTAHLHFVDQYSVQAFILLGSSEEIFACWSHPAFQQTIVDRDVEVGPNMFSVKVAEIHTIIRAWGK